MVMDCAVEDVIYMPTEVADGNMDLYKAYITKVEWDFMDTVDDLLASLDLSHLRVRAE